MAEQGRDRNELNAGARAKTRSRKGAAAVPKGRARKATCPICGKPLRGEPLGGKPLGGESEEHRYRPFCSKACADIDLSRWLDGRYAIPGAALGQVEVEAEDEGGNDRDAGGPRDPRK